MAEPIQVIAKTAVFFGVALLLGAGVFARWIAPLPAPPPLRRGLRYLMLLGALLVSGGSALEVVDAITRAAGAFDPSLAGPYLLDTRHGNAVVARCVLTLLAVLAGGPPRSRHAGERICFAALGLALLLTLTLVSHAGAQGQILPILADLVHLAGVAAWGGSVLYAGWLLAWPRRAAAADAAAASAQRLSTLAAGALAVIVASGVYAAVVRLPDVGALTRTPYGRSLLLKIAGVVVVAAIAAVNRWVAVPWMTREVTTTVLRRLVRIESLAILAVLALTGSLVSQPLPQPPATVAKAVSLDGTAGPWILHGTVAGRGAEGFMIELHVQNAHGAPAPDTVPVDLQLTMPEMVMEPLRGRLARVGPGLYRGTYQLPMTGRWQLTVRTAGGLVRVAIPTQEARVPEARIRWDVAVPGLFGAVLGLGLAVTGLRRLGAGTRPVAAPLAVGIALTLAGASAGVWVLLSAH